MQSASIVTQDPPASVTGRVLAVDENEAQRSSIARSLRQAGFDVLEAASGEAALASLARNPDVVVLDACLPGIGPEVCRRMKLDPKTSGIPVLQVATGPPGKGEGWPAAGHGDAYLPGPLHPSELVAVVRALLRMRRAEEEARRRTQDAARSRAELSAVLDTIGEGLCQLDDEGRLLYMNPAAERILGLRSDDVQGCCFHGLVHPDAEAHTAGECTLARVLNGARQRPVRDFFRRQDGSLFPVECTSDPIVIAGKITGTVLSFRDVTDRQRSDGQCFLLLLREQAARRALEEKTAEVQKLNAELEARVRQRTTELEAANRELEAFSYSVSHDLRAPLRSIAGYAQVLLEHTTKLDPADADMLRRLCTASRHMGQVIESLLQLSRVTFAGIQREEVDLSALARGIALELRRAQPRRGVRFRLAAGLVARGDPSLLRIALENLLGNAWKFSSRRRTARIEFGATPGSPASVYFVRDNGVGFDMARAGKLFSPFQRLHRADDFDGCGIGLATVARIIRRHGGEVWAEAKPGRGATFFFSLP